MSVLGIGPVVSLPNLRKVKSGVEYVCWTRMQAEAGQPLEAIIARKELERQAGGGMFCWGVGNAPAVITNSLARLGHPVLAVFSIMKSKPKSADVKPARIVVWQNYFDAHGAERPLPPHVLVTSRGDSNRGPKERHFALMCWSERPLELERGIPFDPTAFRNAGRSGAPVGASQVTTLLQRTAPSSTNTHYEANLQAWLVGSYWVRLSNPLELSLAALEEITACPPSHKNWLGFVNRIRQTSAALDCNTIPDSSLI